MTDTQRVRPAGGTYDRALAVVLVPTALATALGFLRELTIAFFFGASAAADALAVSIYLYDTTFNLFFQGGLAYAVVPVAAALVAQGRQAEQRQLLTGLTAGVVLAGLAVVAVLAIGGELIAGLMFVGRPEAERALLSQALAATGPGLALVALAGLFGCVLQANERYAAPPLGRLGWNVLVIACLVAAPAPWRYSAALAGLAVGAAVQFLLASRALPRGLLGWELSAAVSSPVRQVLRRSVPAFLGIGSASLILGMGERSLLGMLDPGSVAVANYALRTVNLASIVALAFFTVGFAQMALEQGREDRPAVARSLLRTVRRGLFVLAPLAGSIYVLAEPTVLLLFGRGAFEAQDVLITGSCLRVYSLSVIPGFLLGIFTRLLFVAEREWAGVAVGGIVTVVALSWDIALLGPLQVLAIPSGYTLGFVAAAIAAGLLLRPVLGRGHGHSFRRAFRPVLIAAVLAVLCTHVVPVGRFVQNTAGAHGSVVLAVALLAAATVYGAGFVAMAAAWRLEELAMVRGRIREVLGLLRRSG